MSAERLRDRTDDVIHDEICVIVPHMSVKKTTIFILGSFVFSPLQIHSLFLCLKPLKFDYKHGHVAGNLNFFNYL